jgi:uncharacterized protein (TIGR00730 family)
MAKYEDRKFVIAHHPNGGSQPEDKPGFMRSVAQAAKDFFSTINEKHRISIIGNGLWEGYVPIYLENIHDLLGKADAFVFYASDDVDLDLKLLSTFVGVQTGDKNMFTKKIDGKERQKPVLLVGSDEEVKPLLNLIHSTKYISDEHKENIIMHIKDASPDNIVAGISLALEREKQERHHVSDAGTSAAATTMPEPANDVAWAVNLDNPKVEPDFKVCVFCSASRTYWMRDANGNEVKDNDHNLAYQLGKKLAEAGYGVVSGAGQLNMMGSVVRGAQSVNGWTAGSNTPTIRQIEKLPAGIDAYIDMPDIYKRMKVMIDGSDGFIIAPGGTGSIQEFLTLVHYKKRETQKDYKGEHIMNGKPIVILNPKDKDGKGYWDALIAYAEKRGISDMFKVVDTQDHAVALMKEEIAEKLKGQHASTPWSELVRRQQAKPQDATEVKIRQAM